VRKLPRGAFPTGVRAAATITAFLIEFLLILA